MKLPRRKFLHLAAGAAALPAVSRIARAQTYPSRPVRIIVGFPAGGAPDIIARLMGQSLSERLGQPFIIENRPGAGSNIGTEVVVQSAAGRLHAPPGRLSANAINATLYDNLNFNFIRDIAPVASIVRGPFVMVVNPSVPAKTVPEFIAYAKANPGKINMASAGIGTATHVFGELFKMMTGVDMLHVPYRGSFLPDLLGGQVQVVFDPMSAVDRVYSSRQAARACGDHCDALGGAAGCPDRGRLRAGLRGERLVRHRRAQEHAHRDRRQAQQGNQCRSGRPEDEGAARRPGWHVPVPRPPTSGSSSPTKPKNGAR